MLREECSEQELQSDEGAVGADYKIASLLVQVGNRYHPEGASCYPERATIQRAEFWMVWREATAKSEAL